MREKAVQLLRQLARHAKKHDIHTYNQRRLYSNDGFKAFASPPSTYIPTAEEAASLRRRNGLTAFTLLAAAAGGYYTSMHREQLNHSSESESKTEAEIKPPSQNQHLINWSGTYECIVKNFYQPESIPELENLVRFAHENGQKLRCIGSGLSPNALAFQEEGMVGLSLLDKILNIDTKTKQVTVQAGAKVQEVADSLRKHGLTLPNYASIREQTIGGFTQVSAHGTGAAIPPVDDAVVAIKLVTPALGTIELSAQNDPDLFYMARVGLGCLGIVSELTLQCVPAHKLIETTFVATADQVRENHSRWLRDNKHLRYMWIPSTDSVVVVQCNQENTDEAQRAIKNVKDIIRARRDTSKTNNNNGDGDDAALPLRELLRNTLIERSNNNAKNTSTSTSIDEDEIKSLSPTQCRDALLAIDPLNPAWVSRVNHAEAQFWQRNQGIRSGWSDEILGFDCGGQQWVLEVAFPCGKIASPRGNDIEYMHELMKLIEKNKIPAPSPIEQRWTCGSASKMSPAHGSKDDLFSWIGIIMYLPDEEEQRMHVTKSFREYSRLCEKTVMKKYSAVEHWAKIEVPENRKEVKEKKERLKKRYPVGEFESMRKRCDPKNILGNKIIDELL